MSSRDMMERFRRDTAARAEQHDQSNARRWLNLLLDEESFVDLGSDQMAADSGDQQTEGDGLVAGYGQIDGRMVVVCAQDAEVANGGVGAAQARRFARAISLAVRANAPFIALLDAKGLRVDEGTAVLAAVAELYDALADANEFVPTLSLVLGSCPGTLSFLPSRSDIVIVAEDRGGIFLQGPGITSAEEGKGRSPAEIGGAEVHASRSGLATMTAADAEAALAMARDVFGLLPDNLMGFAELLASEDDPNRSEEGLDQLAEGLDSGFDAAAVLDLVFDVDRGFELYPAFAPELLCRVTTLAGAPVVAIATAERQLGLGSARKLARVLDFAERFAYPVVSFMHLDGFVDGPDADADGISEVAAEVMALFSDLDVPRVAIVCGRAIGAGLMAFNGRLNGADVVYAWPTAEIGLLRADAAAALFRADALAASEDPLAEREGIIRDYAQSAMGAAQAVRDELVDEVILPSATRPRIFSALQVIADI